ncbi:hypothetical protein FRC06_010239, partial [Ceratobasidium sp. 370]
MIDSWCYHKLAKRLIVPEDVPMVEAKPLEETTTRQGTSSGWGGRAKGKAAPVPAPPVPQVAETLKWACPMDMSWGVHAI